MAGVRTAMTSRLATVRARANHRRAPVPLVDSMALAGAGFETLCEVVGAISMLDAQGGFFGTGWNSADADPLRTYTTSPANQRVGVPAALTTRRTGFSRAFSRLHDEAAAVGADGVIGIRVESSVRHTGQAPLYEVVIAGIAVRAIRGPHARRAFTTSLSGTQVANAVRAGLMPVTYLQCPVMGVRHIDYDSGLQLRLRATNGEVEALTDLVTVCRDRARADFIAAAKRSGADCTVVDEVTCTFRGKSPETGMNSALATVCGTSLARFAPPDEAPRALTVVPLSDIHPGAADDRT